MFQIFYKNIFNNLFPKKAKIYPKIEPNKDKEINTIIINDDENLYKQVMYQRKQTAHQLQNSTILEEREEASFHNVRFLMHYDISPDIQYKGFPLIMKAAQENNLPAFICLINEGANINARDPHSQINLFKYTLLHSNNLKIITALIKANPHIKLTDLENPICHRKLGILQILSPEIIKLLTINNPHIPEEQFNKLINKGLEYVKSHLNLKEIQDLINSNFNDQDITSLSNTYLEEPSLIGSDETARTFLIDSELVNIH